MNQVSDTFLDAGVPRSGWSFWQQPSWPGLLADSGLPNEVQSLIAVVLKRCRLSRNEKSSVAMELISHFADGLERDRQPDQLIEDFGSPTVAASLIQTSKLRNRPMWKRALKASGWGTAGLAAAYVIVSIWFHSGKPTPTVDYVVRLNETIASVPDSEKAWPIYRPMWTKYGFSEGGGFDSKPLYFEDKANDDFRLVRPGDPGWNAALAYLEKHSDLIDSFRRGAKKPFYGVELKNDPNQYSDEDFAAILPGRKRTSFNGSAGFENADEETNRMIGESLYSVLLSHVQVLRSAARMFVIDTRAAVEANEPDRVVNNIETMLGLARHGAEGNVLVCSLIGYAIAGMAFNEIEEIVSEHPDFLNATQLGRLQRAVDKADLRGWLHFDGERIMVHDMIQRIFTDDGNGDGRMTPQGLKVMESTNDWWSEGQMHPLGLENPGARRVARSLLGPASLFVSGSRKEIGDRADALFDVVIEDAKRPFWESEHPDFEASFADERYKYLLLSLLMPAYQQVRNAMDRTVGRQEGVRGALAIHRHRLQTGEWPEDWNSISKTLLARPVIDQFTGKQLRFRISEKGPLVYSVGNDRDDDGGKDRIDGATDQTMPRNRMIFRANPVPEQTPDGDWIVWPHNSPNN